MAEKTAEVQARPAVLIGMRPLATFPGVVTCATVTLAIGASVLVGWAFHIPLLVSWGPGYVTLKVNTAICFVAGAGALLAQLRGAADARAAKFAVACSTVVLVLGLLTLLEYALRFNLGIDQLLVRELLVGNGTSQPGRMAPNTALAFLLLGSALHAARSNSDRARRVSQACGFGALFLVLLALVGYAYRARVLVGLFSLTRMAVPTVLAMLALGVGTLWLTAGGGWLAEVTTRGSGRVVAWRLLPAALLIPFSVGLLTLRGYRAGLYDAAFLAAIVAVVETVSFATLVWLCARFLNESERGRTLAGQDELTKLLNRRGFLLLGEERLAAGRRLGEDGLLLFIDLDGMKGINDQFGHAAGDRALTETARVLRSTFRDDDVVARLGGDEFAVIASRVTMHGASTILSRLDAQLARLNAEPGRDFSLVLSTGVTACLATEDRSIAELLQRADRRMYEQKQARRAATGRHPPQVSA